MSYKKVKISDIGKIVSGATPKTKDVDNYGGSIAWITPADLSGYTSKYISHGSRNITQKGYDSCSTHLMPRGTVLFSSRAPIGYVAIAENPICTNQGFKSIVPNDDIDSEFLYYQLQYLRKKIQEKGSGTTFKEISGKVLGETDIVVPSLEEQSRIVAHIEELFSELDKAVDTLKTTKEQLEVYRQAVLKDAFSYLPETVEMDKIADMIDPQPSHRTPPEYDNGIPYIGIGDIDYQNKKINFEDARKVSPEVLDEHLHRYTIHKGDFVMGKIGTIGKPYKIPDEQNYALSANVILIQPNKEKIYPEFLFWQFSSSLVTKQLTLGAKATSQPAFGIKKARLLSIKICELEKQFKIIKRLEAEMSCCDNIEKTVDTALAQADAMRQSILKQAFEG